MKQQKAILKSGNPNGKNPRLIVGKDSYIGDKLEFQGVDFENGRDIHVLPGGELMGNGKFKNGRDSYISGKVSWNGTERNIKNFATTHPWWFAFITGIILIIIGYLINFFVKFL